MDRNIELTLEQELSLRNFTDLVRQMSREQAQDFSIAQHKQMMIREIAYQDILKHEWKLDLDYSAYSEQRSS